MSNFFYYLKYQIMIMKYIEQEKEIKKNRELMKGSEFLKKYW